MNNIGGWLGIGQWPLPLAYEENQNWFWNNINTTGNPLCFAAALQPDVTDWGWIPYALVPSSPSEVVFGDPACNLVTSPPTPYI